MTPAKGQKWSHNGESVNVSNIDTFIILKPGVLGKNNLSIWAPFLKLDFYLWESQAWLLVQYVNEIPHIGKKVDNFGEIELKLGALCCILVRPRLVGSYMTMATNSLFILVNID